MYKKVTTEAVYVEQPCDVCREQGTECTGCDHLQTYDPFNYEDVTVVREISISKATRCVECRNDLKCTECPRVVEIAKTIPEMRTIWAREAGWKIALEVREKAWKELHDKWCAKDFMKQNHASREGIALKAAEARRMEAIDTMFAIRHDLFDFMEALETQLSDREEVERQALTFVRTARVSRELRKLVEEWTKDGVDLFYGSDRVLRDMVRRYSKLVGKKFLTYPIEEQEDDFKQISLSMLHLVSEGYAHLELVKFIAGHMFHDTLEGLPIQFMTPLLVTPIEDGVTYTTSDGVSHTLYI